MKAIHNCQRVWQLGNIVGNYMLKYNFESNSQLGQKVDNPEVVGNYMLKYNFESNSQPIGWVYQAKNRLGIIC